MIIEFITKNYKLKDSLKEIITKKIDKLDKFFEPDTNIKVMLKELKDEIFVLELTIVVDSTVLRAEVSSDNMFANIDLALPKLEKQIIRHHTKLASKFKKLRSKEVDVALDAVPEPEEFVGKLVKKKSYTVAPMSVDDAIEELELVGHSFYVFTDKKTHEINVLYKRKDGDYGLIEAIQ